MNKIRNSSFEILRLVCMVSIVLYHMLIHGLNDVSNYHWFYNALTIIFHFGVPVFILISGWFSITLTIKRVLTIIVPLFFYTLLLWGISLILNISEFDDGHRRLLSILFCKDDSPLWFIQPYLLLCIVSPILNVFFDNSSLNDLIQIYIWLGIVVFGFGFLGNYQIARYGYTLFCFSYLYLIGRGIHRYSSKINNVIKFNNVLILTLLIIVIIVIFKYSGNKYLSMIAGGFYAYNSPLMYIYSILIFYTFSFFDFKSKVVNYVSQGAFSIFLIASNPYVINWTTNNVVDLYYHLNSPYVTISACLLFSITISGFCLIIDMITRTVIIRPTVGFVNKILNVLYIEINKCI